MYVQFVFLSAFLRCVCLIAAEHDSAMFRILLCDNASAAAGYRWERGQCTPRRIDRSGGRRMPHRCLCLWGSTCAS